MHRGLVILGVIGLVAAVIGLAGSFYKRCCLTLYLFVGGLVTLGELAIDLTLIFNKDGVMENLKQYSKQRSKWNVRWPE